MSFVYLKECNVCGSKLIKKKNTYKSNKLNKFLLKYYDFKKLNILEKFTLEMFECENCSHIFQGKVLSDKKIYYFYNDIINVREKYSDKNDKTYPNICLSKKISKKLKKKIKILDFGSGYTEYDKNDINLNFYTYDISKKKSTNNINNINDLKKYKFDFIIANQVFEHLKYPKLNFNVLCQILNNDGFIKLEIPSSFFFSFKFFLLKLFGPKKIILHDFFPIEHINSFSKKSLDKLTSSFKKEHINNYFWIENKKNFKNILKYLSIKFLFFRILSSLFLLKNGGHYLILKK